MIVREFEDAFHLHDLTTKRERNFMEKMIDDKLSLVMRNPNFESINNNDKERRLLGGNLAVHVSLQSHLSLNGLCCLVAWAVTMVS